MSIYSTATKDTKELLELKKVESYYFNLLGDPTWVGNRIVFSIDCESEVKLFEKEDQDDLVRLKGTIGIPWHEDPETRNILGFTRIMYGDGTNTMWNSPFLVLKNSTNMVELYFREPGICNKKKDEILIISKKFPTLHIRSCLWQKWSKDDDKIKNLSNRNVELGKYAGICQWLSGEYKEISSNDEILANQGILDGLIPSFEI